MAVQGASLDSDSQVCRDLRASFPAIHSSRRRRRFGSHRLAMVLARASICIQAVNSIASWTTARGDPVLRKIMQRQGPQTRVLGASDPVLPAGPAAVPHSSSGRSALALLVANAVNRLPSMSVNRSCAPGCGRSARTMTRIPAGHPVKSITFVSSATQAPFRGVPVASIAGIHAASGRLSTAAAVL